MAVASSIPESAPIVAPEPPGPLLRLFGAICSIGSVRQVGIALDGGPLDLWVFTHGASEEDEQRIYLHLRAYRALPTAAALDLHLIALDQEDADVLPSTEILFER